MEKCFVKRLSTKTKHSHLTGQLTTQQCHHGYTAQELSATTEPTACLAAGLTKPTVRG